VWAIAIVFALSGVLLWRYASAQPDPTRPGEGLFALGPNAVVPPLPTPPTAAGGVDYDAGRRLLNSSDLGGAVGRLAAAVAADPGNAEYRSFYAHALWRAGDKDRSLAEQAEAARLDPRLRMQYARSLDVAGRSAEAAKEYETLLAKNPDASTVQEDLGRLLFRSGDYATAAAHLQIAVGRRPDDPVLQQELAYSLDQAGDKAAATAAYRRVLEQAPGAVLTRGLLSENLFEQGQRDQAMAVLEEGLRSSPEVPLLQRQMGSLLERTGRPSEAAAAYREYARLAPNAPDAQEIASRAASLERPRAPR
jgi:Flp pilus assembly protein TadD